MSASLKNLRREGLLCEHIPYTAHISENVVRTVSGDYVQAFRIGGASFETADEEDINVRHARLNVLWRTIASPHVAIWAHVIRRHVEARPPGEFDAPFAHRLHERYSDRVARVGLMVNELYLSIVYRPAAGRATGLAARVLAKADRQGSALERIDSLQRCAELQRSLSNWLGTTRKSWVSYAGTADTIQRFWSSSHY